MNFYDTFAIERPGHISITVKSFIFTMNWCPIINFREEIFDYFDYLL